MRKLIIDSVALEITRRCNLSCTHCMRGDAQNMDVDYSVIRNLADQAQQINYIEFTGGEPTLNIGAIRYTLEAVKERKIPVRQIRIVTNGVLRSQDLVDVLFEWAEYIRPEWRYADEQPILLGISWDKYHIGADPIGAERFYWWAVHKIASIKFEKNGANPAAIGRAKNLPEAFTPLPITQWPRQIGIWEHGQPCDCMEHSNVQPPREGETILLCEMFISANGNVSRAVANSEYAKMDAETSEIICNLRTPNCLYDSVIAYNEGQDSCRNVTRKADIYSVKKILTTKNAGKKFFGNLTPEQRAELQNVYELIVGEPVTETVKKRARRDAPKNTEP